MVRPPEPPAPSKLRTAGSTSPPGSGMRLRFASRSGDFSTGTGLGQGAINLQRIYSSTALELVAP